MLADQDTSLSKEVFDTNRGLWLATDQNELYPNPHSYATEGGRDNRYVLGRWLTRLPDHQLQWYSFIGRVLGKALYEGILVDVSFANFFRKFAEDRNRSKSLTLE